MYEGTKVHRKEDGRLLLFRPEQNAIRMKFGAERMSMPSPSINQFVDAVKQTVLANKRWVILFYLEENAEPLILYEIIISLNLYYLFNIIYVDDYDDQVPPPGKGSLYIRPLLMGSGQILGLGAAPEYTFLVYVSPVGNYFKVRAFFVFQLKLYFFASNENLLDCLEY